MSSVACIGGLRDYGLNLPREGDDAAFVKALKGKDLAAVRELLDAGFNPNDAFYFGKTFLERALLVDPSGEILNLLAERYPIEMIHAVRKIESYSKDLNCAIYSGCGKFLQLLIQEEIPLRGLIRKYGLEPLMKAIGEIGQIQEFQNSSKPLPLSDLIPLIQEVIETPARFYNQKTGEILEHYVEGFRCLGKDDPVREFLRRVNKCELISSLIQLKTLRALSGDEQLALSEQNWQHPIFKDPELLLHALKAFVNRRLTVAQMSEILIFNDCTRLDPDRDLVRVMPFFIGGSRNEEAIRLFKNSVSQYCADAQVEEFLTDPILQRAQFYVLPVDLMSKENIMGPLVNTLRHVFHTVDRTYGKANQVVLSPQFTERLLHVMFKDRAPPRLNCVLGPSRSIANFHDPKIRDVEIPSSGLFAWSQSDRADNFFATPRYFLYHDVSYHAVLASAVPLSHRLIFIEIAKFCGSVEEPHVESAKKLQIRLLDQEFEPYVKGERLDRAFLKILESYLPKLESSLCAQIITFILKNKERWEREYRTILPESEAIAALAKMAT